MIELLKGILLGLSITAPIGPTNIELIRRGLKFGWKATVSFWIGVIIALIIYLTIVMFGFSFIINIKVFKIILLILGILFLLYLVYNSIKDFFTKKEYNFSSSSKTGNHLIEGIILTLFNPAILLLWTSILGSDLASDNSHIINGLFLCFGIIIGVIIFFMFLTLLIHFGSKYIKKRFFRYISLLAGLILFLFTVKFIIDLIKIIINN